MTRARQARAAAAALLSFIWPGAGHWLVGARWTAVVLGLPQLLLLGVVIAALIADQATLLSWILNPAVLLGIVTLDVVVLVSRLYAIPASAWRAGGGSAHWSVIGLVTILAIGSIAIQGQGARIGLTAYATLTTVFAPQGPQGAAFSTQPTPSASVRPTHREPIGTPEPMPAPERRPDWADDGRLNVLLIGADAGPGRWKLRTDTMILLSIDVESHRAALIGIPRNLRNAPMPPPLDATFPGGFTDILNALWVWVDEHPGSYPGDPAVAPYAAVQAAIGVLTGMTVDAMVVAELNGFVAAVDAIGGLDIAIPGAVYDSHYPTPDGTGYVELYIPAGAQHLDGWHALAYARTRHQDGDYWRMDRQQTVLIALQRQLRCHLLTRAPELLGVARDHLWTNLPLDDLPDIVKLARRIDPDDIVRLTITPPTYPDQLDPSVVARIQAAVRDVFAEPVPTPGPSRDEASPPDC